jgi:hypothetical protein
MSFWSTSLWSFWNTSLWNMNLWNSNPWHASLWKESLWRISFLREGLNGSEPSQKEACGQAQGQKDSHAVPQDVPLAGVSPRPINRPVTRPVPGSSGVNFRPNSPVVPGPVHCFFLASSRPLVARAANEGKALSQRPGLMTFGPRHLSNTRACTLAGESPHHHARGAHQPRREA